MKARRILAAALVSVLAMGAASCASDDLGDDGNGSSGGGDKGKVVLSGQAFDEAALVASMYQLLLEKEGYSVEQKLVESRDQYLGELEKGNVQIAPEYTGGILDLLNTNANGANAEPITTSDAAESISAGKQLLDDAGITLLDPSAATDTNAFFVTQKYADDNGVTKLSDLEGKSVVLAAAPDCKGRPDCEGGLTTVYGIKVTKILPLGFGGAQTKNSVKDGESQLGLTATTDGTLAADGLVLLEDDKAIQPAQNLVPAVNTAWLKDHRDVREVLNELMATLDTRTLAELNTRVTVDREKPEDVARDYLEQNALL
ncbi:ABC transporter substrate-binding protein [Nocardioides guangzhouensis]|nr:ABC transporter substrate-binding protein [Nocardioides guangzhouensis]